MLACRCRDDVAVDALTIDHDLAHAFLLALGVADMDVVAATAEDAMDAVLAGRGRQARVDAQTVKVGLDAKDELRHGVPHPRCRAREP